MTELRSEKSEKNYTAVNLNKEQYEWLVRRKEEFGCSIIFQVTQALEAYIADKSKK